MKKTRSVITGGRLNAFTVINWNYCCLLEKRIVLFHMPWKVSSTKLTDNFVILNVISMMLSARSVYFSLIYEYNTPELTNR